MFRIFLTACFFSLCGVTASAASCDQRASQLAASEGGKVVSVRAVGEKCEIKLLIASPDGPPVRRTFLVQK